MPLKGARPHASWTCRFFTCLTKEYQQFRPWALHDPTIPISDGDRVLKGLIMGGGMDPGNIGIPSPDAWASMERAIFLTATLGAPDINEFVDFKAFVASYVCLHSGGNLDKVREGVCRSVHGLVGEDAFFDHKSNPLLRAPLFLQMMTGSDLVPINPNFMLKFTFTHTGDRAELPAGAPVPQPPPSCFAECAVSMEPGLQNVLREPQSYKVFQSWFHAALILPNTFNQV
ncbi:hypothetical protein OH76DRAFT_1508497 [Lentinus brumalis]|uniref:Uncharacterized protein n=1 Tax=Lentinus brumalis TaxID=2498619 RepID=A0A371CJ35_9APHY|nr:hypothetical protein OH76DRAFT_1508497 [Polyporus brumalis]